MTNRNCTAPWSKSRPAAFDVFPVEPSSNADLFQSPLQEIENVILTPHPHVGGSTKEAQERIGEDVTYKLIQYSNVGSILGVVNFPQAHHSPRPDGTCFIQVQRNLSGELWKSKGVLRETELTLQPSIIRLTVKSATWFWTQTITGTMQKQSCGISGSFQERSVPKC